MKRPQLLLAALAASLLASSCIIAVNESGTEWRGIGSSFSSSHSIKGSGVKAEEKRHTADFSSVTLQGSIDLRVEVGPETRVIVSGDDNLLEYVETKVAKGNLVVGLKKGSYNFRKPMIVSIQTPSLEGVTLVGSGDIHVVHFAGESLNVNLTGSGDISVQGSAKSVASSMAGSGDIDLGKLHADNVSAILSGSGDVRVHAAETLNIVLSGSGEVVYTGNAKVTKSLSGSGEIHKIN